MEQAVIHSPLGPLTLFAEDNRLIALVFGNYGGYDDIPLFREAQRQLEEYFSGQRRTFSLPMNPEGTDFQRRVWGALMEIPYGAPISYRDLAARVDVPKAFQAVGQANGKNPIPILIPCHRVIAANGTLGGYSGGLERKRFLLELEGYVCKPAPKKPRLQTGGSIGF
ncbi:MAG: methylated-DNA--[protein]-cysteine S-methyltransferase [Evtepia sp.]|uniref:methylated-DNA--[protein]-cysteine S-methyltransferase n=1 Tax=Evtepia sp. TaxID=2773933 RepID=UPI002A757E85|nr:methylated-DNA--[protein]-cysteine S-methyltransferase [Evtepia sp.]MDY3015239.1 methylated-DNA--[protein]-cysteine S-methyltransferase [Evtepia sp.]